MDPILPGSTGVFNVGVAAVRCHSCLSVPGHSGHGKGNGEVVGPVATLKMRPVDTAHGTVNGLYGHKQLSMADLSDLVSTEFTVLK